MTRNNFNTGGGAAVIILTWYGNGAAESNANVTNNT